MRLQQLPIPLFFLLTASLAQDPSREWPYNLPKHQKYWPEHERLVRRDAQVRQQFLTQQPIGLRRMSDDPIEMFFLDYWQFELPVEASHATPAKPQASAAVDALECRRISPLEEYHVLNGTQLSTPYLPALRLHDADYSSDTVNSLSRFLARDPNTLFKRAFQCPTNTTACTSIGRPDSCCGTTEACQIISDTGVGDVGCCPQGQTCSGSVSQCDTAQGYTSCPGSSNGGCCIPGFTCNGIGCVAGGGLSTTTALEVVTVTGTVTPGNTTVTQTSFPPPPPSLSSSSSIATTTSTVVPPPAPTPITPSTTTVYTTLPTNTDTAVVTADTLPPVPVSTPVQGTLTCTSGFNSCPASMGGGCCPTDRACGTGGMCPPLSTSTSSSSSTSAAAAPPVRPTSDVESMLTTTVSSSLGFCPTGYYMCSATYIAGCCQVGRNCDTTDCPISTTNTVVSNGATILVPGMGIPTTIGAVSANPSQANPSATGDVTSAATVSNAAATGQCAMGFFSCAANQGGGCCPSGYACGSMCTATAGAAGPSEVGKADPASGAVTVKLGPVRWASVGLAVMVGSLAVGL